MSSAHILIEVHQLSKVYKAREGSVEALTGLDLQVRRGEILGLLGPNGAGKTTAVKLIMGFLAPSAGEVLFQGQRLRVADPRRMIGYLPESFQPNPNLTVYEYLRFQCELGTDGRRRVEREEIMRLLELVGMDKVGNRRVCDLSKGMGQRVGLAQAFAHDPDVLILDEPTSGLDPIGKSEVIECLMDMKKRGKTVFFCSHILSEVERLCDRIGILVEGRLKFLGSVEEFLKKWTVENLEEGFKREVRGA